MTRCARSVTEAAENARRRPGYGTRMSEQPQTGTGKTAGLPGANADPRNAETSDDERDETVAMGDVAPPEDPDVR